MAKVPSALPGLRSGTSLSQRSSHGTAKENGRIRGDWRAAWMAPGSRAEAGSRLPSREISRNPERSRRTFGRTSASRFPIGIGKSLVGNPAQAVVSFSRQIRRWGASSRQVTARELGDLYDEHAAGLFAFL